MSLTGNAPVKLTCSSVFLRNASFDNDDLGIHYRVETEASVFSVRPLTKLYRWDMKSEKEVLVAEWKKRCWSSDKYHIVARSNGEHDFMPVWEIMPNTWGFQYSSMFDGRLMIWRTRTCSLKLYRREEHAEGKGDVIASYKRARFIFAPHKPCLELFPGYDSAPDNLDMIILKGVLDSAFSIVFNYECGSLIFFSHRSSSPPKALQIHMTDCGVANDAILPLK
ncbi:hypothetical protein SCHPADRAFT_884843 [Schizopora paradoxa]|uniref:DUF6593 domain-containing protein n=1 Tax=Schizopora paradoxa TaxID=27342 RepID=A0A0H2SSJ6_9AGAM|nr:hypothetical protein SCHPADRAFT_884843 [Schizopora paradoxa]